MSKEELLQMLQGAGMSDDDIKALLKDVLDTLDKDFVEHDEKVDEQEEESAEKEEASRLLGVDF